MGNVWKSVISIGVTIAAAAVEVIVNERRQEKFIEEICKKQAEQVVNTIKEL